MNIIVKNYEHFNRTMGCYIKSKAHYEKEMSKRGFVDWETGEKLVAQAQKNKKAEYKGVSKKALEVMQSAWQQKDNKGRIKPSDRLIDGMKECGVAFNASTPKKYNPEGGFDASGK